MARALALALSLCALLAPLAHAEPVAVSPEGDAVGFVAVGGRDARSEGCVSTPVEPCIEGVAVAIGGTATSDMVAVSGTGHADGGLLALSGGSAYARCDQYGAWVCEAIALNGQAGGTPWSFHREGEEVCTAGFCAGPHRFVGSRDVEYRQGDARANWVAVSRDGNAYSHAGVSFSLHGNATYWKAAIAPEGHATGGIAVSVTGTAEGSILAVSVCGDARKWEGWSGEEVEGRTHLGPVCDALLA